MGPASNVSMIIQRREEDVVWLVSFFLVLIFIFLFVLLLFILLVVDLVVLVDFFRIPCIAQIEAAGRTAQIIPPQFFGLHLHVAVRASDLFHPWFAPFPILRAETI